MTKRFFLFFSLALLAAAPGGAGENIDLNIRFYDKSVYYINSPIFLKVELMNNSAETYRFKLADARSFSVDFTVKTLRNRVLKHANRFILERNSKQRIFFREISLSPGESYSFIEDLSRFITIDETRQFIIQATFYPELFSDLQTEKLVSNTLSLSIHPSAEGVSPPIALDEETAMILRREALSPDEIVSYFIRARQMEHWDKFFLYLDLESLYLAIPGSEVRYRNSSESERIRLIEDYREGLMNQTIDYDILLVPQEFRILRTTYTETEGDVAVLMKFRYPDFTELKEYSYRLAKKREIWYITGYTVKNLGTE